MDKPNPAPTQMSEKTYRVLTELNQLDCRQAVDKTARSCGTEEKLTSRPLLIMEQCSTNNMITGANALLKAMAAAKHN
jgi:hypothetical protein